MTREEHRRRVTELVLMELAKKPKFWGMPLRKQKGLENAIARLQKIYQKIPGLENEIYKRTDYLPDYSPRITAIPYNALKRWSQKTFERVQITGEIEKNIAQAKKGRLILLPTHNDMFDTVLVAFPFLEAGLKPPVFHAGDNLRVSLMSYVLPRWNVLFVKRKGMQDLDYLVYAKEIEHLAEIGENQTIYPEATRSRLGLIAPIESKIRSYFGRKHRVAGMAKGYLQALLAANQKIPDKIYYSTVTVSSVMFPDLYKDLQKTGAASKMNLLSRLFESARAYTGNVVIHYSEPEEIPKSMSPSWNNILKMCWKIRGRLKDNITVLPENLLAYTMKYISIAEPEHSDLPRNQRLDMMASLYLCHMQGLAAQNTQLESGFAGAVRFYQKMGTLTSGYIIRPDVLMEYNSNRIQHFLNTKDLRLP